MECVFVRHGEASWEAATDAERSLTPAGEAHARAAARWLSEHWQPNLILVSPYRRAQQTAAEFLGCYSGVSRKNHPSLTPDSSLQKLEQAIDDAGVERLLLIGHNPLFSNSISWFCGDDMREVMAPASLALIELPVVCRDAGRLRWLRHAPDYSQIASCQ
ncbi:phosphohistidine phosphatase [Litorivivens lipolytica]|uniref:Phosphohistidine phosphatase n=1 Tax=Litorivivens lipolytica TaxID=1524264 RepID=A0A7W4W2D8_9GAMM|nr:phosphohistidine phosphatase SixA [Litorivivens lipolytica]MBB3046131.1 phosphohistidine phosphatase [Litorivivens lipolytica]